MLLMTPPRLCVDTASDSRRGYVAWGGPPELGTLDGSLVPAAAGGSLPFLPAESLRCLRTLRARFDSQASDILTSADGGKRPNGFCVEDIHEKRESIECAAKGRFPRDRRSPSVRARLTVA